MNIHALFHQAKSEYSYAYDEKKLHILFRTAKNDVESVKLSFGDPFDWTFSNNKASWNSKLVSMTKRYQTDLFDYYFIEVEPKDYRCKYAFLIENNNEHYFFGSKRLEKLNKLPSNKFEEGSFYDLSNYFNYPYLNKEDLADTPSWVKDTYWYQIFMDRFYSYNKKSNLPWGKLPVNNHELYGGDILGVIDKLPYLKDLGVSGIYFTPIFESKTAHKYDIKNYFKIDPQFGTNDDFKLLVEKAHQLDIKVVLDAVLNHCGWDHPYFQDVVKNGRNSIYADCFFLDKDPIINFDIDKNGNPKYHGNLRPNFRTFAYTPHMPKWNTGNPLTQKHLLDSIEYWIKEYDIDGWRLDVSNEVSHQFLRKVKEVSKNAKKDTFIFGENWDSSMPWLRGDQMDSVMNYDLSIPIWQYFDNKIDLHEFKNELISYTALTPKNVMQNMFNQLDTHDTVRMKRRLKDNDDRLKIAYILMFISAGAPNIYYGSEVGLSGEHDPDNRRCFNWDESTWNHNLRNLIKSLIKLRKSHKSLMSSDYHFIDANSLSLIKKDENESILILINDSNKSLVVNIPTDFQGKCHDLLNDVTLVIEETIKLPKFGYKLLKRL
ncbi:glycoside hydrolase family 13 protein [Acholeplasma granularum]|uniref:glycoside hydrolase family 13 protein n=1 Tax=Acholeplasma granularum TaxID=264635 RepID=UPI00046F8FC0|nr:glycoside hydrolase family 13 protein [Acholeplasma granularum]